MADGENLNLRVTHAIRRDDGRIDHDQRARVLNIALRPINHRCRSVGARRVSRAKKLVGRTANQSLFVVGVIKIYC